MYMYIYIYIFFFFFEKTVFGRFLGVVWGGVWEFFFGISGRCFGGVLVMFGKFFGGKTWIRKNTTTINI